MSSCFSDDFFDYLSVKLEQDPKELKSLFDNFFSNKSEKSETGGGKKLTSNKSEKSEISSKKLNSKKSEENEDVDTKNFIKETAHNLKKAPKETKIHKCERMPRGKSEMCGKPSKKSIDVEGETKWYCGTENSGCYKSILGSQTKQEKEEKSKKSIPEKLSTSEPKKSSEDIKGQSLIHRIVKTSRIDTRSIMVDGSKLNIHYDTRILFHRDGLAYGVLDKDNKTILPFNDENVRWLEAHNVKIEQQNKKEESEEEEEEDDEQLIEDSDEEDDIDLDSEDDE